MLHLFEHLKKQHSHQPTRHLSKTTKPSNSCENITQTSHTVYLSDTRIFSMSLSQDRILGKIIRDIQGETHRDWESPSLPLYSLALNAYPVVFLSFSISPMLTRWPLCKLLYLGNVETVVSMNSPRPEPEFIYLQAASVNGAFSRL